MPKEDVDRKPVGGTKMDKDILARTVEKLHSRVTHKQVVSRREFKGRPFNSKPKLIHFKVSAESPPGRPEGGTRPCQPALELRVFGGASDTSPGRPSSQGTASLGRDSEGASVHT